MKSKLHLLAILTIVGCFFSFNSNAQDLFYTGSIIKNNGEKENGLIKVEVTNKDGFYSGVTYKKDKKSGVIYYKSNEIAGFEIETGDVYKSFEIFVLNEDGETGYFGYRFLKNTITGYLSLYEFKNSNTFRYFIQKGNDGELIELLREQGSGYVTLVDKYQGNMDKVRAILEDCESVAIKFNNEYLQDLNKKNIRKMVIGYNECKSQEYTLNYKSQYPASIAIGGMYDRRIIGNSLTNSTLNGAILFTDFYHKSMGKNGSMTLSAEYTKSKGINTVNQENDMRFSLYYNYHLLKTHKFDPYLSLGAWYISELQQGQIGYSFLYPYIAAGMNYHISDNFYIKAEYSSFVFGRLGVAYKF
jgi:hypothetical protein